VFGPRYLAVLPGDGTRQRDFVGLEQPPLVESIDAGDLEIILRAPQRSGLQAGTPVTYRQVRVGTVLSVGLTSDAGAVEARVHIDGAYTPLIRRNTRFWRVAGAKAEIGLSGLVVDVASLESLLVGGVALATPPLDRAGDIVHTGHRFPLADRPSDAWLQWEPIIAVGSAMLPPGATPPRCLRGRLTWKEGLIFKGTESRQGWLLRTELGLLGPANLLTTDTEDAEGEVVLEVAGEELPLDESPYWSKNGLAAIEVEVNPSNGYRWPRRRMREPDEPEDCLIIFDPNAESTPLDAARLTADDDRWLIDDAVPIDASWHGGCIVSRTDGKLIGVLLVDDDADEAQVAILMSLPD
jgi:hypothetical protein